MTANKTISILGAGKLGTVLANLALRAGYEVAVAGSGPAKDIALSINVLTPGAIAMSAEEAASKSDVIILAIPLSKYRTLPKDALAGKLVIDAMNYWWEVDGHDTEISNPTLSSSEMIQNFLPNSRVVKALSHMGYHHLLDEARPKGQPGRKAIAVAANDAEDTQKVAELVDDLGFDPLLIGELSGGVALQPGAPAFGANTDKASLMRLIDNQQV